MNDRQLNIKVRKDADRVKKDLITLLEDSATRFSRIGNNVNQVTGKTKDEVSKWVDDGVSQLSVGIEKMTGDAKETVIDTAGKVKKDLGHSLRQYNSKAQEVANRVPGAFGKSAANLPWVVVTIALVTGFLIGIILPKPVQRSMG
jgi:hypothetical protein